MSDLISNLKKLYETEKLHHIAYSDFAARERDPKLRPLLSKFAKIEEGSSNLWASLLKKRGEVVPGNAGIWRKMILIRFLRKIFGMRFALMALEYREDDITRNFKRSLGEQEARAEAKRLVAFMDKEDAAEDAISRQLFKDDSVLNNIRDVIFGMNDGLVEVLAAVVGLGAFLQKPQLIFLAGLIVAVSGTSSMAGGAYISTDYETKVKGEVGNSSSLKSALYVGSFYIIGAIFPLLPFAFGLSSFVGIAAAIVITSLVLSFTAAFIAIVSGRSISRAIGETLAISLGAAAITIAIGYYARVVLHLTI
jgi:VIT1/CCC1 family predicted Fe2+/Mn2+ transporter